jgi:outer membrane protein assembly factor BamB
MDRYFSSPVAADGRIYMASEPGVISVLKPGADWEVLQANKLDDEIHATPVFMDSRMFVRTQSALYAFGVEQRRSY